MSGRAASIAALVAVLAAPAARAVPAPPSSPALAGASIVLAQARSGLGRAFGRAAASTARREPLTRPAETAPRAREAAPARSPASPARPVYRPGPVDAREMASRLQQQINRNRVVVDRGGKRNVYDLKATRSERHFDKATQRFVPVPQTHEETLHQAPPPKTGSSFRQSSPVREMSKGDVRIVRRVIEQRASQNGGGNGR